jgi:hypothetical protein
VPNIESPVRTGSYDASLFVQTLLEPVLTGEINRQGPLRRPRPASPRWRSSERP